MPERSNNPNQFQIVYDDDQWDALKVLQDAERKCPPSRSVKDITQVSPTVWLVTTIKKE